jgi:hypothetical protein
MRQEEEEGAVPRPPEATTNTNERSDESPKRQNHRRPLQLRFRQHLQTLFASWLESSESMGTVPHCAGRYQEREARRHARQRGRQPMSHIHRRPPSPAMHRKHHHRRDVHVGEYQAQQRPLHRRRSSRKRRRARRQARREAEGRTDQSIRRAYRREPYIDTFTDEHVKCANRRIRRHVHRQHEGERGGESSAQSGRSHTQYPSAINPISCVELGLGQQGTLHKMLI